MNRTFDEREQDRRERVEEKIFEILDDVQREINANTTEIAVVKARIGIISGAIGIGCGILGTLGGELLKHFVAK